ncbi:MAG: GIY-YIG nuclease family protein [Candidatus Margulisbacteria bacterium]|jgi:putative endonuclease|nr:GIY-YIG nuclease family protein [Candidatus Margulisiibacteriota bacterium]
MAYVYVLECSDGSYYTGSTDDLECRLYQHQHGKGANYTCRHAPVKLVYYEEYARVTDAFFREKAIQRWSHKKKQALVNFNYADLHKLAECRNETHCRNGRLDSARRPSKFLSGNT